MRYKATFRISWFTAGEKVEKHFLGGWGPIYWPEEKRVVLEISAFSREKAREKAKELIKKEDVNPKGGTLFNLIWKGKTVYDMNVSLERVRLK